LFVGLAKGPEAPSAPGEKKGKWERKGALQRLIGTS